MRDPNGDISLEEEMSLATPGGTAKPRQRDSEPGSATPGRRSGELDSAAPEPRSGELDPTVRELVARAQRGDHEAFEHLYRLHVGRVYALCLRMIADREQAESLTQDAFVRAWQKLATYQGRGLFVAWLCRLAANVVIENRRAATRQANWLEFSPDMESIERNCARADASMTEPFAAATGQVGLAMDLERAIAGLPPGARLAFVLHDVNGYKHREIAAMTGVATGTVKAQLHRARKLLREALGDE
jgi:RNA polymerase sigma-70 factor (ECF subfamily)